MSWLLLAAASLIGQRLLGMPDLPPWCNELILPMVLLVAPLLRSPDGHWIWWALALGLAWDAALEPVVGPGGVAWSAAAVALHGLAAVLADRTPRAWVVFGATGSVVLLLARWLALAPLGLAAPVDWASLARSALLTGAWCGAVGGTLALDLPSRWRRHRARRLR